MLDAFDEFVQPMKGQQTIIDRLNARLADELTAINQYMVHSEMCANWGFNRLHKAIERRAIGEMKHAEKLIARILFLEGQPNVNRLNKIRIGATVEAQHQNDRAAEEEAVKTYNEDIRAAAGAGDNGTRELLEDILQDEEEHLDWIETQLGQIQQIGLPNYLTEQTKAPEA
jgi:bacterioferritin